MYEHLAAPYSALAEIYNQAGFAAYAQESIPRYIAFAQSIDWAGRRVIDLGCGTGVTSWWISQQGVRVLGVDNSPYMLAQAAAYVQAQTDALRKTGQLDEAVVMPPDFVEMDVRQFESPMGPVDLVLAVGEVFNAIHNLRELELAFTRVNQALEPDKLFIFDLRTIRGLASDLGDRDMVFYDDEHTLSVIIRNQFSYETLSSTRHYLIYRQDGGFWHRFNEQHTERGYPTQGVIAMLQRARFDVVAVLNPDMSSFDPAEDVFGRVVFVARKA